MTAPRLFNRSARITAYQGSTSSFFPKPSQGIVITDLRTIIEVELDNGEHPNTCHVIIHNCNATTRRFLEAKPLVVRVDAGLDGNLHNFFVGDLRYGISKLKGATWETRLQLADGDRATRFARTHRSYAPGSSVQTVLRDLTASMSLVLPGQAGGQALTETTKLAFATALTAGHTVSGDSYVELQRLLAPFNLNASIQNGRLQILADEETEAVADVVISEENGMQESPDFGTPEHSKKPPHATVHVEADSRMVPGRVVRIKSRDIDRRFKISKCKHSMDTMGKHWRSTVEALPL